MRNAVSLGEEFRDVGPECGLVLFQRVSADGLHRPVEEPGYGTLPRNELLYEFFCLTPVRKRAEDLLDA